MTSLRHAGSAGQSHHLQAAWHMAEVLAGGMLYCCSGQHSGSIWLCVDAVLWGCLQCHSVKHSCRLSLCGPAALLAYQHSVVCMTLGVCRMLSNRESARRSRKRKQEHMMTLEQQIDELNVRTHCWPPHCTHVFVLATQLAKQNVAMVGRLLLPLHGMLFNSCVCPML